MSDYQIQIGDIVSVAIPNSSGSGRKYSTLIAKAEVKYMPCATGDSWIFVDLEQNEVHYISLGIIVSKLLQEKVPNGV